MQNPFSPDGTAGDSSDGTGRARELSPVHPYFIHIVVAPMTPERLTLKGRPVTPIQPAVRIYGDNEMSPLRPPPTPASLPSHRENSTNTQRDGPRSLCVGFTKRAGRSGIPTHDFPILIFEKFGLKFPRSISLSQAGETPGSVGELRSSNIWKSISLQLCLVDLATSSRHGPSAVANLHHNSIRRTTGAGLYLRYQNASEGVFPHRQRAHDARTHQHAARVQRPSSRH